MLIRIIYIIEKFIEIFIILIWYIEICKVNFVCEQKSD